MKYLITLFIFTIAYVGHSQNDYSTQILAAANESAEATKEKNIDGLLQYVHPNIISLGGGESLMKSVLESQFDAFVAQDILIESITYGDPSEIVMAGEEMHCILPQKTTMSLNGQPFDQETNLLAASLDKGETWKFIDLSQYDRESLKIFIPNFNEDLKIPIK